MTVRVAVTGAGDSGTAEPLHTSETARRMVHCNMVTAHKLKLDLEDVLADLWRARRSGDLGRLVLITFCDLRRWARVARCEGLAQRSQEFVLACPHVSREEFLSQIDLLIAEAERAHALIDSSMAA